MKKSVKYVIFIVLITLAARSIIYDYCINNVYINTNARLTEDFYPEYAGKIMGYSGYVKNKTIFPIRVKKITPIGGRGMIYYTTLVTTWGMSEIERENLSKYESLEDKIIPPFADYDLGFFYKFTDKYTVDPSVFEIVYSIFGIEFKKVIINEPLDDWLD